MGCIIMKEKVPICMKWCLIINTLLATFTIEDFDDANTAISSFWIQGGDPFNMKAGTHMSTICYRIQCNPINQ